ncbi:MAG: hypothetical protein JSR79_03405 [Proteobacteria bacterium]|nr:hypothetical protein [Pseudomonadota bacterium]
MRLTVHHLGVTADAGDGSTAGAGPCLTIVSLDAAPFGVTGVWDTVTKYPIAPAATATTETTIRMTTLTLPPDAAGGKEPAGSRETGGAGEKDEPNVSLGLTPSNGSRLIAASLMTSPSQP